MALRLVAPDGTVEVRRVPLSWLQGSQTYTVALEVLATTVQSTAILACDTAGVLEASVAGGGYTAVGTTFATGVDLGAFTAGERKTLTLRATAPAVSSARTKLVNLLLGIGTDP